MKLSIIADSQGLMASVSQTVMDAGYLVEKQSYINELEGGVQLGDCDACIVASHEVDDEVGDVLCRASRSSVPVIMVSDDKRDEALKVSVECGSSLYVTDPKELDQLDFMLRLARARHTQSRALLNELSSVKATLENRKLIERAKGIIMKQRRLDEASAYHAMRKLAMDNNKKLHEVAAQILTAAEVLT